MRGWEPLRYFPPQPLRTLQLDRPGADSSRPTKITTPDLHHPAEGPGNRHGNVVAGVEVADVDFVGGDHQPPLADPGRHIDGTEADHVRPGGTVAWSTLRCMSHSSSLGSRSSSPSSPIQRIPHEPRASTTGLQSSAGRGQHVARRPCHPRAVDDPGPRQLLQPLTAARRHPRHPAAKVVECRLPGTSSRTRSSVHRSSSNSIAFATGQNWWYEEPMRHGSRDAA